MYRLVEDMRRRLQAAFPAECGVGGSSDGGSDGPSILCIGYGHLGDGNLHLNISGG